jgi:hypothetical protein
VRTTASGFWSSIILVWISAAACTGRSPVTASGQPIPVPDPTLLSIAVTVQDLISRPVPGARVELTTGTDAGTFKLTGADGRAIIDGHVPRDGTIGFLPVRITKEGYKETIYYVRIPAGGTTASATITFEHQTVADLSGEYSLTLEAASTCGNLPQVAKARTYSATIRTTPGTDLAANYFDILLSGTFFRERNVISAGAVGADGALVIVGFPVAYHPIDIDYDVIAEQVDPDAYVTIFGYGKAVVSSQAGVFSGPLEGTFSYCPATPPASSDHFVCPVPAVICQSLSHRLTLARR